MHKKESGEHEVHPFDFTFKDFNMRDLSEVVILGRVNQQINIDERNYLKLGIAQIEVDFAAFVDENTDGYFPPVLIRQLPIGVTLSCRCGQSKKWLCTHQARVLYNILKREEFRIFFDDRFRNQKIKSVAFAYGLENEARLDDFFEVFLSESDYLIKPKTAELIAFGTEEQEQLKSKLLPNIAKKIKRERLDIDDLVLVFGEHKHFRNLTVSILEAKKTKSGRLKQPIKSISASSLALDAEEKEYIKFFIAAASFKNNFDQTESGQELTALKAILKNPLQLATYLQVDETSATLKISDFRSVDIKVQPLNLSLLVKQKTIFSKLPEA